MKFGKRYQEALDAPGIQPEWRRTAIEYRKLKKVINRVASELEDLGLTSEVLRDLLERRPDSPAPPEDGRVVELGSSTADNEKNEAKTTIQAAPAHEEEAGAELPSRLTRREKGKGKEVVIINGRRIYGNGYASNSSSEEESLDRRTRRRRSKRRRATASYELAGTSANPEPRIRLVFESASSASVSSEEDAEDSPGANIAHTLFRQSSSATDTEGTPDHSGRITEITSEEEEISKPARDLDEESLDTSAETPSKKFTGQGKGNTLLKRMYGLRGDSDFSDVEASAETDYEEHTEHPGINRQPSVATIRIGEPDVPKFTSMASSRVSAPTPEDGIEHDTADADADDESALRVPRFHRHHRPRRHRKEVFIPLNSDSEFFALLAKALSSLAALQIAQKQQFKNAVELLANEVSKVSSPSRPKSDLYVWREIFALWVEAQIFESMREKDRGERDLEEVEDKLDWFVEQVAKRKLAKRMKNKESREALETFIKLNVELLDLKKFQLANEEAARKILKKHDKRTALTASLGFPEFIAAASSLSSNDTPSSSLLAASNQPKRVLVLPGLPSLPHILLATLTKTLMPIIPQLEDYECLICGDVAYKPIKLDCGHRFCVRCLVKMQKRGQDNCPQCRGKVVLRADASNLDTAMLEYMKMWFPKEVRLKDKSNRIEAGREEAVAMGLVDHKCAIQ